MLPNATFSDALVRRCIDHHMFSRRSNVTIQRRVTRYTILSRYVHTPAKWKPVRVLEDDGVQRFRRDAFGPSQPAMLPKGTFLGLPATRKWFTRSSEPNEMDINQAYLGKYGNTRVPTELTYLPSTEFDQNAASMFQRGEAPLEVFLQWAQNATAETPQRLYVAQASFSALPDALAADCPTPEIVSKAGTGDIYDINLWLGLSPTYTPLHRDPNPNFFVQIAGSKLVRLLPEDLGHQIFARVQSDLGKSESAAFRGEEMMKGQEKSMLEAAVWADTDFQDQTRNSGYEACLHTGDGLYIPKGWWHSIKGVGQGVSGSVNWWFR